jgi:hypothetical protein
MISVLAVFVARAFCFSFVLGVFLGLLVLSQFPNTSRTAEVNVKSLWLIEEPGTKACEGEEV